MGRDSDLDTVAAIQPPLVELKGFYDKECPIANRK